MGAGSGDTSAHGLARPCPGDLPPPPSPAGVSAGLSKFLGPGHFGPRDFTAPRQAGPSAPSKAWRGCPM